MESTLSLPMKEMIGGNGLLIICSIFYFLWWLAAFKPERKASNLLCGILLVAAFAVGMAGIYYAVRGISSLHNVGNVVSVGFIVAVGMILYILLLATTFLLLKRQVTTELALIIGWAVLELCMIDLMFSQNRIGTSAALAFCILIAVTVVISMICYLIYYRLSDPKRYVDGMIPLILVAVVMTAMDLRFLIR